VGHAIDLDYQTSRCAIEVRYEWTQWHLTAKLQSTEPMVAQFVPKLLFGWRWVAAHFSRVVE
jgi:hypothetical protein